MTTQQLFDMERSARLRGDNSLARSLWGMACQSRASDEIKQRYGIK